MSSVSNNPLGLIEGENYNITINRKPYVAPFLGFNVETKQYFFNVNGRMSEVLMQNINPVSQSPSFNERTISAIGPAWSSSTSSYALPPTSFSSSSKNKRKGGKEEEDEEDEDACVICDEKKMQAVKNVMKNVHVAQQRGTMTASNHGLELKNHALNVG